MYHLFLHIFQHLQKSHVANVISGLRVQYMKFFVIISHVGIIPITRFAFSIVSPHYPGFITLQALNAGGRAGA